MSVGVMKDYSDGVTCFYFILFYYESTHIHWVAPLLLSYILRDVSFAEVDNILCLFIMNQ
jgi:hypothetical protein